MEICPEHSKIAASLARIEVRVNGSYDKMAAHVEDGKGWRTAIVSVVIAVFINIISFAYIYGKLSNTVERNTLIINRLLLEDKIVEARAK